jgi:hypothetical protein
MKEICFQIGTIIGIFINVSEIFKKNLIAVEFPKLSGQKSQINFVLDWSMVENFDKIETWLHYIRKTKKVI